jgi:hypothetical protein
MKIQQLLIGAAEIKLRLLQHDARMRKAYLPTASPCTLQIGGGTRLLAGWLNTDLERSPGVIRMARPSHFPLTTTFSVLSTPNI